MYKFQAELSQLELLQLQDCKILFLSQCNILLKLSIKLVCSTEAVQSMHHQLVLTLS